MAEFVIDADGHIMEDHKDIFAHIKGNFSEMDWHSTWPMFDADGWQRGLARKGKREDPGRRSAGYAFRTNTASTAPCFIRLPRWHWA